MTEFICRTTSNVSMNHLPCFIFGVIYLLSTQTMTGEAKRRKLKEIHVRPSTGAAGMGQEGHLTCPKFGGNGCKLICEIFCDFYGCQSEGHCSGKTCQCYEKYTIFSKTLTSDEVQKLPASVLWRYKFGSGSNATDIFHTLKSEDTWENFELVLRNPSETAISIKSHLLSLHPDWTLIQNLKPVRQGYVDDFIRELGNKYDDEHLEQYNDLVMDYVADKYYYSLKGFRKKPNHVMNPKLTVQTKYFYKLINLCQNAWLMDYVKDFVKRKGYSDSYLMSFLDPKGRKKIPKRGLHSILIINAIDFMMTYEKKYEKSNIFGSQKHTLYYLLSKGQIDELNDFDFQDLEEEMAKMGRMV